MARITVNKQSLYHKNIKIRHNKVKKVCLNGIRLSDLIEGLIKIPSKYSIA